MRAKRSKEGESEDSDKRKIINSGYWDIRKDTVDIFDIKYIYRFPHMIIKGWGSRMVLYVKTEDGKLRQSSIREVNYSNDTLVQFLKRIEEINPNIELDNEYQKIIEGEIEFSDASQNTVKEVEQRLRDKGEKW